MALELAGLCWPRRRARDVGSSPIVRGSPRPETRHATARPDRGAARQEPCRGPVSRGTAGMGTLPVHRAPCPSGQGPGHPASILVLQRWIGAPDFPSESAVSGHTSLKRERRAFENAYHSMPFARASGLLQATSPASFAFSTPSDLAL